MQEIVGKLVSRLEKGKPSPINPYFFHFYSRFECLRDEETIMLVATKYMLQFDIAPELEVQLEMEDEDSERESLGSEKIRKLSVVSSGLRKKSTYRVLDGKTPVRVSN